MTDALASTDAPPPLTTVQRAGIVRTLKPGQLAALLGGEARKAAPWVRALAHAGVTEAQVRWGRMLLEGAGVKAKPRAALDWFKRAAHSGSADACNMVGRCLENGWGAPADPAAAFPWYDKAAKAGDLWAQYNLAHLYFNGEGVAKDLTAAFTLYQRAALAGHPRAMNSMARALEHGWGVERDMAGAVVWYRRSAEAGYFRGQFNHGALLVAAGRIDEALPWLERACQGAHAKSRTAMVERVLAHPDPRMQALGLRMST